MILFLLTAAVLLAYGGVYAVFCVKKGGISAALGMLFCLLLDLGLMALLIYYRTNT